MLRNSIAGCGGLRIKRFFLAIIVIVFGTLPILAQPTTPSGNHERFLGQPVAADPHGGDFSLDRGLGLFVGVNEFTDKSLVPLKYAVNDAIGLAHYFVTNGLIDAANCHLLLSGTPVGANAVRQLEELKAKKILPQEANYTTILEKVRALTAAPASNFIVLSFGTHGFFEGEGSYLMPADGNQSDLRDISISTAKIGERLRTSKTKKAIILVDACRAKTFTGTRGGANPMTDAFRTAFDAAYGRAILLACSNGQVSYESDAFQQGVFTHFLLEGLRGKAGVSDRGFITLGTLIEYVAQQVQGWMEQERPGVSASQQQQPTIDASETYRQMPIARSAEVDRKFDKIAGERGAAMDLLTRAYGNPTIQPKFGFLAYTEISSTLAALPAEPQLYATSPLGQIIQMINGQLQTPTPSSVEALVSWWNSRKGDLSQGTVKISTDPIGAALTVDGIKTALVTPIDAKLPSG